MQPSKKVQSDGEDVLVSIGHSECRLSGSKAIAFADQISAAARKPNGRLGHWSVTKDVGKAVPWCDSESAILYSAVDFDKITCPDCRAGIAACFERG